MRLLAILLAAQMALATTAQACAEYTFQPVFAVARIRDPSGRWREATVEAADKNIRIEAESVHTPWGRLVVSGNVESGSAIVFSVPTRRPVPPNDRVVWRTSLADALPELGITDDLLVAPFGGEAGTYAGRPCSYLRAGENARGKRLPNRWSCASDTGLPLFLRASSGQLSYRVISFERRPISAERFALPSGYLLQNRKPAYLSSYDC